MKHLWWHKAASIAVCVTFAAALFWVLTPYGHAHDADGGEHRCPLCAAQLQVSQGIAQPVVVVEPPARLLAQRPAQAAVPCSHPLLSLRHGRAPPA